MGAATGFDGPLVTYGVAQAPPNASNPQIGPNAWYAGDMILDPRGPFTYQPGNGADKPVYGWPGSGASLVVDQSPSTASTSNIVNAATPSAGTPLTLVSASGSGITIGTTVINAKTGIKVTGLLGIDVAAARTTTGTFANGSAKITFSGATMQGVQIGDQITLTTSGTLPTPFATSTTYYVNQIGAAALMLSATPGGAPIAATSAGSGTQTLNVTAPSGYDNSPFLPWQPPVIFGQGGTGTGGSQRYWNPCWSLSRTLILTNNGNDTSGTYTVAGFDQYGYPLTQVLTGPSTSTVSTTKAFKYIQSITPAGTINSTSVSVGTNDVFGLPLRTDYLQSLLVYMNNGLIAPSSATFVAADITTPSGTTGDVRGTYYSGTASDGTKRYTIFWNPWAPNMTSIVGLLGQPQF